MGQSKNKKKATAKENAAARVAEPHRQRRRSGRRACRPRRRSRSQDPVTGEDW